MNIKIVTREKDYSVIGDRWYISGSNSLVIYVGDAPSTGQKVAEFSEWQAVYFS